MTEKRDNSGFTLIELLVVIAVISLLAVIAVPSMVGLFRSGAMTNARNIVDAQLKAARGLAIRDRHYTGVHYQRGLDDQYWMGIVRHDVKTGQFDIAEGTEMVPFPVGIGAGQVIEPYVDKDGKYQVAGIRNFGQFACFTIVFGPNGRLVGKVDGGPIVFKMTGTKLFMKASAWVRTRSQIWDSDLVVTPTLGARAMCLFEANELELLMPVDEAGMIQLVGDDKIAEALNDSARFLPVNPYTAGVIRND